MLSPFATNASLFRFIRAAQAAPSIHNTQPWSFWIRSDDRLELRANWKRHLPFIDPRARELTISCGAALFNLRMAIRAAGYEHRVWLIPDERNDPELLASVEIVADRSRRPTATEQRLYDMIPRRHTNREPFRGPRVPMNVIAELEHAARREHAFVRLLHRHETRALLQATAKADRELATDPAYVNELRQWTGDGMRGYGVPTPAFGPLPTKPLPGRAPVPIRDLGLGRFGERRVERFEKRTRLLLLSTENDRPLDWLRAGQALQRVLLTATCRGAAASFLTQPFEINDRQRAPVRQPSAGFMRAHLVIRLGYARPVAGAPRAVCPDVVDCRVQPPRLLRPAASAAQPVPS